MRRHMTPTDITQAVVRSTLRLPTALHRRIETARGDVPLNAWVKRACEERLARDTPPPVGVQAVSGAIPTGAERADAFRRAAR